MRLIDADGSYTLNASDNTGYSLSFGGGIISVADEYGHIEAEFFADDAPTVDAVPVVRCKDCKFYRNHGLRDIVFDTDACHWNADEQPDPDDFCSCGERRTT